MKKKLRTFGLAAILLAVAVAAGGFLVAASGIIPIKASSGHWAVTEWLLHFAMRRSVSTHTLGMDLPALDEPWMVLKGAGHYEIACRPCHGSPELERLPRVAAAMTPHPPQLPPLVGGRDAEELFYVVKHGIKFTGMPAWPSRKRDDEVHAMVAFLLELPRLTPQAYRDLVGRNASAGARIPRLGLSESHPAAHTVQASCAPCHGADGGGRTLAAFPKLAGQKREYLFQALKAYAEQRRHSGIMEPLAAALDRHQWAELADYYSGLPVVAAPPVQPGGETAERSAQIARGEQIAREGIPEAGVPSCMDCHGPGQHRRNPAYPELRGQFAEYLALQLELFRERRRGGSPYAHIMEHVASRLEPSRARDVTEYYAALSTDREP